MTTENKSPLVSIGRKSLNESDRLELESFLNEKSIHTSFAVRAALLIQAEEAADFYHHYGRSLLTIGNLYLALLDIGLLDRGSAREKTSLGSALVAPLSIDRTLLDEIKHDYYSEAVASGAGLTHTLFYGKEMVSLLGRAAEIKSQCSPGDRWLAARHLVAAIIDICKDGVPEDLRKAQFNLPNALHALRGNCEIYKSVDDESGWLKVTEPWSVLDEGIEALATPIGGRESTRREALDEELCLEIDAYAQAIADNFTSASNENDFVFALYGSWGRGKSTLMKKAADFLRENKTRFENAIDYSSISFSAWKYPTRPEVWVHLYQAVSSAAKNGGLLQKIRLAFRVGLLKNGWSPLIIGFALLAISRVQIDVAHWIFDGFGVIGLLILGSFLWKIIHAGKQFTHSYLAMPDHAERLGLQAVIGEDLKNLLTVWINPKGTSNGADGNPRQKASACDFSKWWPARSALALIFILFWVTLVLVSWKIKRQITPVETRNWSTLLAEPATNQTSTILVLQKNGAINDLPASNQTAVQVFAFNCFLCFIGLFGPAILFIIAQKPSRHERVILVVDDLDRCEPEQMLTVIESIRLFLDDKEISRRLQVAMLIDRKILNQAIVSRAKAANMLPNPESCIDYVRQQKEKLFVVSLELPPLTMDQVEDLAKKILNREQAAQIIAKNNLEERGSIGWDVQPNSYADSHSGDAVTAESKPAVNKRKTEGDRKTTLPEVAPQPTTDVHFSDDERKYLIESLAIVSANEATPRALRAYFLRYQLARLLLRKLGRPFNVKAMITYLANRIFNNQPFVSAGLPANVREIVDAVAGNDENSWGRGVFLDNTKNKGENV